MTTGNSSANVLIVGMGDLGTEVAKQLLHSGINVTGLRRSQPAPHEPGNAVKVVAADVSQPLTLEILQPLEPEIIVYCVAAGAQADEAYKSAYVDGLYNVLATQKNNTRLKHVFFVSSTRVYGQDTDALLDESVAAMPSDFGGRRLLEAEHLLQTLDCGSTVLRLSGIYGPGRLRMINLARSPEAWPQHNSWSNRIHRDDAAAFTVFLIRRVLAGAAVKDCYIVTDSRPVPQYEVLSWLAEQMRVTRPGLLPVAGGKRLSNQLMLATGFKLQYPDYEAGYRTLLPA